MDSEPRNIRLTGSQFEPTGLEWDSATSIQKRAYWKRLGKIALKVKRQEIQNGIGVDGNLQPVKRRWGGPALVPHNIDSRTYRLLAVRSSSTGVTLFWRAHGQRSWATVLSYHAYQHGPRRLPVRNTIGISYAGRQTIITEANAYWQQEVARRQKRQEKRVLKRE